MRRIRTTCLAIALVCAVIRAQSSSGVVLIQETDVGFGVSPASLIHDVYDLADGFSSRLLPTDARVRASDLDGVGLFIGYMPSNRYGNRELDALAELIARGGRVLFLGETGSPVFEVSNDAINEAVAALGGSLSSDKLPYDSGTRFATVASGQILPHPMTACVDRLAYAAPSGLEGGEQAQPFLLTQDLSTVFGALEPSGPGSIAVITDSNLGFFLAGTNHDNPQLFLNLATIAPASATSRNGSGLNFPGFAQVTPAVIGSDWQTTIGVDSAQDLTIVAIGLGGPLSGVISDDLLVGELLCRPPYVLDLAQGSHSIPIPLDCALVGTTLCTQGAILGSERFLLLQNALDVTIGNG